MATPQRRRIIGSGYEHDYNPAMCDDPKIGTTCVPVETAPKFEPPEFTIEISYHDYGTPVGVFQTGWKYVIRWTVNGDAKFAYKYGHTTERDAENAAEARAIRITKAAMPTRIYKFKHFPDGGN